MALKVWFICLQFFHLNFLWVIIFNFSLDLKKIYIESEKKVVLQNDSYNWPKNDWLLKAYGMQNSTKLVWEEIVDLTAETIAVIETSGDEMYKLRY